MKKLLIDISTLGSNNQNAVLGIKYFLQKNKEDEITIIADSNYTVTLNGHKRVTIAQLESDETEIDPDYKNIKQKNLQILFTLIKKDRYDSFVTFNSLDDLKPYIDKYFIKTTSPLLVASYANYETHKCTIFGDLGYNPKPTREDMTSYLRTLKEYARKIYNFNSTKFKLLSNGLKDDSELIKLLKSDSDYQGEVITNNIYKAETDILLCDANTCSTAMNSIEGAIDIYDEFIKASIKKNVGLRYFVYPMFRNVFARFHMEIDKKLISGGMTLLGFDKKIVFINKNVIAMGVKASIDNCAKF